MTIKSQVFQAIIEEIETRKQDAPFLVGINGIDGSGKSRFAKSLKIRLKKKYQNVILISIDDFHNPKAIRYRKGKDSPEGFYKDSYDYTSLKRYVLDPIRNGAGEITKQVFHLEKNRRVPMKFEELTLNTIVILEGIFLFRKRFEPYWDLKIFLDVNFNTALQRNIQRTKDQKTIGNTKEIIQKYKTRYMPGQQMYLGNERPKEKADIIINNDDYNTPIAFL